MTDMNHDPWTKALFFGESRSTNNLKHDPWTELTDMAAAHVEVCIRSENRKAVAQLLNDLCNNTKQKRDVLVDFLCTKPIKE